MSSLLYLRAALRGTLSDTSQALVFDFQPLERETAKLHSWLGVQGAARPGQNAIVAALRAFYQDQLLQNHRQARLVCFGCLDPVPPQSVKLIEDAQKFPRLLDGIDNYLPNPRSFRRCYRGLLHAYFAYDYESAQLAGEKNWELLRTYLRERAENTIAPGTLPGWVEALQANPPLLSDDPGITYGRKLLDRSFHLRNA